MGQYIYHQHATGLQISVVHDASSLLIIAKQTGFGQSPPQHLRLRGAELVRAQGATEGRQQVDNSEKKQY